MPTISEFRQAVKFANATLDRTDLDPDDEYVVVSRQFLRAVEREEKRKAEDFAEYDPYRDLVAANRDAVMEKQTEAVRRVRRLLALDKVDLAREVLDALCLFHPMNDDWKGWPEGSECS